MRSFASELRLQCARKGSIAQLCKATGINRQQFNKYLAGQVVPGARTLRKICAYLGVSEAQLMSDAPTAVRSENDWASSLAATPQSAAGVPGDSMLQEGFYRSYFPVHSHPNLVARWLVDVRNLPGGGQIHTCRNHFEDGAALGYPADYLRYRGPVRYGLGEACLIGTAHVPHPLHGILFVNLRPVSGQHIFSAMVLTRRPNGPIALSGALQFLGAGCAAREALANMGVVRLDDPSIDATIVKIMRAPAAGPNWIQAVNEKNLQADEASGGSRLPEVMRVRRLAI